MTSQQNKEKAVTNEKVTIDETSMPKSGKGRANAQNCLEHCFTIVKHQLSEIST